MRGSALYRKGEKTGLQCDSRNYFSGKTELNHTVTNRKSQPLYLLRINDGRARLSDSIKTDFNPLNKFMKTHDIKQRGINMLTIMSGSVPGLAAFLFGTRLAVFTCQMIAAFALKIRKILKNSRKVMSVIRPIQN